MVTLDLKIMLLSNLTVKVNGHHYFHYSIIHLPLHHYNVHFTIITAIQHYNSHFTKRHTGHVINRYKQHCTTLTDCNYVGHFTITKIIITLWRHLTIIKTFYHYKGNSTITKAILTWQSSFYHYKGILPLQQSF